MGNTPRIDPQTMQGFITDVATKRRIRNYIQTAYAGEPGMNIIVQQSTMLNRHIAEAKRAAGVEDCAKQKEAVYAGRKKACELFYDVRAFGAVANGGVPCTPHFLVYRGEEEVEWPTGDRVVSKETVAQEIEMADSINVIDEAVSPDAPSGPNRTLYVAVAFLAGLFLAVAIVVLMGLGVGYYVSTVAIPQIASVMGDPSALPPITRSLLETSDWVKAEGHWLILGPALFGVALALLRHVPGMGLALDRVGLALPLFGKVGRYAGNALFNQTLAILLESGISVVESLALIRGTLANAFYRRQVAAVRADVLAGKPLSEGIAASALDRLSPLSKALVRVGESSGNLAEGLRYVGDFYAQALARRLDLLGKLVEPALVIVVGGMVAYVYVAFFMGMAAMNAAAG